MDRVCENCRYIDREGKMCLNIDSTLPSNRTCIMWKVNVKKEIEKMKKEMQECEACRI